jgi:uncharacterized membrane protein
VLGAVTAYTFSVFLHVTAVVVGLGATFAEAITFPVAMKLDQRHLPYVHQLGVAINRRLTTPAFVVILVTGLYQVSKGDWSFGSFWISATFAILIVLGGLTGAYFIPTDRRLGAMAARELAVAGEVSDDYRRQARTEGIIGAVAGLLIVVAVFLMVTKP